MVFDKLFCKHDWNTHAREKYEWSEEEVIHHTRHWFAPKTERVDYSAVVEVLICKKCGKIKQIDY